MSKSRTNITTATTTTVVAAPGAGTTRNVKALVIHNKGSGTVTVSAIDTNGTTSTELIKSALSAGETLAYDDNDGWQALDLNGLAKSREVAKSPTGGAVINAMKVGTAAEAAGQWYCYAKDSGFPGAHAPGTPGLNGRATDGTSVADAGCIPITNPSVGNNFISSCVASASVSQMLSLIDLMWINTGLVVTTLTAQALTPTALPARDVDGTTNGKGVMAGLLVTAATTNAGVIANTTISYTNSAGVAGRTATIAAFPATAVVGTVVWFQLAAGDVGVRSVQSVTLGTSYVAGAVSLILARFVLSAACLLANTPSNVVALPTGGVRIAANICLLPIALVSATTAATVNLLISVEDK
jgi:hypothetical protein